MTRFARLASLGFACLSALPMAAAAQPTGPKLPFEYAVKFVCGTSNIPPASLPPVASGNYFTLVNIHNPNTSNELTYKAALAQLGTPGKMIDFQPFMGLKYDEAFDIDCRLIRARLIAGGAGPVPAFFTGFLVIQSAREVDVVAVYTAAALNPPNVASIHTERVPVRRVQ